MGVIFGLLFGFLVPIIFVVSLVYFIKGKDDKEGLTTKEFFLEIGIFTTLVSSIVSFVYILFLAIDKRFQDVLTVSSYADPNADLASMVSVLVVVFPLYLVFAWMKAKNFAKNRERTSIKAFEYGVYLIMLVTILFFIGSLIAIVYNFLMGDLSAVFGLKVATMLLVSLALFGYSYFNLKRDFTQKSIWPGIFTAASLLIVLAGVVYSVSVIGSPAEMRRKKFDDLRLSNLSEIQNQILNYWQREYKLPAELAALKGDGMSGYSIAFKDPKTKMDYVYKVVTDSVMEKKTGEDCRAFYPNRYMSVSDSKTIACEVPSKAVFELCGTFESVRVYDENGVDQSGIGFNRADQYGLMTSSKVAYGGMDMGYYNPGYDRNPNWNHDKGEYCFKRTIDPAKYSSIK